jgi:predicted DNA-binding transcriptional regulator AlpA
VSIRNSADIRAGRPRKVIESPRRLLQTGEAACYLGVSASLLRKMRMRGPEDPAGQGPKFIRLSPQLVVYEISALDAWVDFRATTQSGHAA